MRIAQVAPLYESVPPKMYGGTERIVSYLTEELILSGHAVTLFASGDSKTNAELVSPCDIALRLNKSCIDPIPHHIVQLQQVQDRINDFDIIHYHNDYLHFPFSKRNKKPTLTTLHGRLDIPDFQRLYKLFGDLPFVSISNSQRTPFPYLNWLASIYHGLPENLYPYTPKTGNYLLFLGRISPEKRPDRAIEIARKTGIKLIIAAKISEPDIPYFENQVKPLLDPSYVNYIGEVTDVEKKELLSNALALLFPIDWPEPFGIVMIESFACGTPVIAFNHGSVPEIVTDGETGFIVNSIEETVKAVKNIDQVKRDRCRKEFETRFTSRTMTTQYLNIYEEVFNKEELHHAVF